MERILDLAKQYQMSRDQSYKDIERVRVLSTQHKDKPKLMGKIVDDAKSRLSIADELTQAVITLMDPSWTATRAVTTLVPTITAPTEIVADVNSVTSTQSTPATDINDPDLRSVQDSPVASPDTPSTPVHQHQIINPDGSVLLEEVAQPDIEADELYGPCQAETIGRYVDLGPGMGYDVCLEPEPGTYRWMRLTGPSFMELRDNWDRNERLQRRFPKNQPDPFNLNDTEDGTRGDRGQYGRGRRR